MEKFNMLHIFILPSLLFCFPSHAKTTFDYFEDSQNGICKQIIEEEGSFAINMCIGLMLKDSEEKLERRVKEIKKSFKKTNNKKLTQAFIQEQKMWQNYKKDRCIYFSSDTIEGSHAYDDMLAICQSAENYRRIDTLEGEP